MKDATTPEQRHRRSTRPSVRLADKAASSVITLGGLVVVIAVLGIGVYLVAVVVDLFRPGAVREQFVTDLNGDAGALLVEPDEHQMALIRLFPDGRLQTVELRTGAVVHEQVVTPRGRTITALARAPGADSVAIGYDDGSVQVGEIGFETEFLSEEEDEPEALRALEVGQAAAHGDGVVQRTPLGQLRLTRAKVELAKPAKPRAGQGAVTGIDLSVGSRAEYVIALREDGSATFDEVRKRPSLTGGPPRLRVRAHALPMDFDKSKAAPGWAFVIDSGAAVVLIWPDGSCLRYDTSDPAHAALAESTVLVDAGRRITAAAKLLGGDTLIIGDDAGDVYGYFTTSRRFADTPDHRVLVRGHTLSSQGAPITAIGVSSRGRTFITGDADGRAVIRNMTSHAVVATLADAQGAPITSAMLTPKMDGAVLIDAKSRLRDWSLNPRHPEATWRSLFGKVWYEGTPAPSYVYQSSSGDDSAEAKFSLMPLIFGTLKATVYTMLIALPLGILAAIYTSEFLSPRLRSAIKPSIEMMASLPSVVLGFIAAMVLAPIVRDLLPGALLAFVGVPIGVLFGAYLWHFAPVRTLSKISAGGRLAMIFVVTIGAGWVALALGPAIESALFQPSSADVLVRAGSFEPAPESDWPDWVLTRSSLDASDARHLRPSGLYLRNGELVRPVGSVDDPAIRAKIDHLGLDKPGLRPWLDGVIGGPWPGWFLVAFPASAILISILLTRLVDPRLRAFDRARSPRGEAAIELVKFALALALSAALAALTATALSWLGLDARDSFFGVYQQRNTLVVGVVMGVAVIPIIYTITDDAMTSVPDTLRSASLGAGATRWQTAVRVVLPVAMSGVFSACMIGLGRAVGETMIVLMATGNTPIMDWSIFDGLRSLSANIAVELPEAPMNSTHYRVLFLCGLVLFAVTFIINAAAEIVRQRVRGRSASL